jgi:hypothetical protein
LQVGVVLETSYNGITPIAENPANNSSVVAMVDEAALAVNKHFQTNLTNLAATTLAFQQD